MRLSELTKGDKLRFAPPHDKDVWTFEGPCVGKKSNLFKVTRGQEYGYTAELDVEDREVTKEE